VNATLCACRVDPDMDYRNDKSIFLAQRNIILNKIQEISPVIKYRVSGAEDIMRIAKEIEERNRVLSCPESSEEKRAKTIEAE
jgi:hypothetical protein